MPALPADVDIVHEKHPARRPNPVPAKAPGACYGI
jgi:hypothetical protein